ncbi:hypothetical protein BJ508DRAFT_412818 [Ascobolus immersus RN42]|uniref:F-box domain-containing protein n=1 Tax=Ascobolus immersus RN42 TaxID=1160509 RepID=A0A3N4IG74_ASCIM|nr:hypothetical protein BJ508DRAFT_412818 [Ascobolus immersus RN42]
MAKQTPLGAFVLHQINLARTASPPAPILRLPVELRLIIYRSCSAFTLLNLAQTCTFLYKEIPALPQSMLNAAFGYQACKGGTLRIDNICGVRTPEEAMLWYRQKAPFVEAETPLALRGMLSRVRTDRVLKPHKKTTSVVCLNCYRCSKSVVDGGLIFVDTVSASDGTLWTRDEGRTGRWDCCGSGIRGETEELDYYGNIVEYDPYDDDYEYGEGPGFDEDGVRIITESDDEEVEYGCNLYYRKSGRRKFK